MVDGYRLQWLDAADAGRVAAVERRLYERGDRTGRRDIREQLGVAEIRGENLSMGLFHGNTLVGYCLLFIERERARISQYLGVAPPPGIDLTGPGLYLADVAVLPAYRGEVWRLVARLALVVASRADTRDLPMDALCSDALLPYWVGRHGSLRRMGARLNRHQRFTDPESGRTLHWLQFRRCDTAGMPLRPAASTGPRLGDEETVVSAAGRCRVGVVDSLRGWRALEADWDRLWELTPGASVFSSHAFLRAWWLQLGANASLYLVVVVDAGDTVRAIAPMQVLHRTGPGPNRRCLGFLGLPSEVDRPVFLASPEDTDAAAVVADYLLARRGRVWSSVILYEQDPDSPFLAAMHERLKGPGLLLARPEGPSCPSVNVGGTWPAYLASRSRGQRRSLKRHLSALQRLGAVALECVEGSDSAQEGLRRYLAVEARSWKAGSTLGVGRSSAHIGFLEVLAAAGPCAPVLQFRFLTVNGADIAATLGIHWRGCLYSLHIAHDRAWDGSSPGFVLTALELEDAFARDDCDRVDYLGGFLGNKRGWATEWRTTTALFAQPATVGGCAYHLYHFRGKQLLKSGLTRIRLLRPALRWQRALSRRTRRYA